MSLPSNILSSFRSYSYHQILTVCDSTETANLLSDSTEIIDFQHERDVVKFTPREIRGGEGRYIVIIDGMSDVTYNINSSNWETIMAPSSKTVDGMSLASTIELDGQLEIFEPNGAKFLDTLSKISDSLGSDPNGLVFMLKTIFVGWNDDGTTQDLITTVRPLLFSPYDITAVFDQSGAKYVFTFVGITNGVGKTAPVTSIGGGKAISIAAGEKLPSVIAKFNSTIDNAYGKFKQSLQDKFDKAKLDIKLEDEFREVKYVLKISGYDNYITGNVENVRIANKIADPILQFNTSLGIEEALSKIMMSSAQVVADKPKFIFKITSNVESTPEEYVITYEIHKYELKTVEIKTDPANVQVNDGQVIEFDYVFTGKNVDIIDLDIKMDLGMAFFQTLVTSQNLPNQADTVNGQHQDTALGNGGGRTKTSSTNNPRKNTPLYLGSSVADTLYRNTTKPVDVLGFQAMLHRHAAIENIQAAVTIHGNPQLLDEMLPTGKEITNEETEAPKKDQTINPKWLTIPTMVKINIKMPADANDPSAGFEPFWYEGFYSLFAVNNIFSNGEFTQKLDMFSLPVVDETSRLTDDTPTDVNIKKTLDIKRQQVTTDQVAQEPASAASEINKVAPQAKISTTQNDGSCMTAQQRKDLKQSKRQ